MILNKVAGLTPALKKRRSQAVAANRGFLLWTIMNSISSQSARLSKHPSISLWKRLKMEG